MQGARFLSKSEKLHILSRVTIFMGIGIHELTMIADKCVITNHPAEQIIIEQNETGHTLYVILQGRVEVSLKTHDMGWKQIKTLGQGNVFGEISILKNIPTTARIKTLMPCQFLTIGALDFLKAYQYFPPRSRDNIQLFVAKRLQELGRFIPM